MTFGIKKLPKSAKIPQIPLFLFTLYICILSHVPTSNKFSDYRLFEHNDKKNTMSDIEHYQNDS